MTAYNGKIGDPSADPRIAHGYDPDADGSYYPDPEDYPPTHNEAMDATSGGITTPVTARLGRRQHPIDIELAPALNRSAPPQRWAAVATDPADIGTRSSAGNAGTPRRQIPSKGVFAALTVSVLGVAAILIALYGHAEPSQPRLPSSVVTHPAPTPTGDTGIGPAAPTSPGRPQADPGSDASDDDGQLGRAADREGDDDEDGDD